MTAEEGNGTAVANPAATPKPKKKAKVKKAVKKVVKKAKKKATSGGGGGRTSAFSGKRIVKLVKENPRREGTVGFKSFRLIKSGMTYDQYIKAGGRRQDLAFDLAKKYVRMAK